jgi:hypothetical protein
LKTSIKPFSTVQRVFIVEHYFRTQSYEAVKQSYQVNFPDAAVPNKSTISGLKNQWRYFSQIFYGYVETGLVMCTTGWGTLSTDVVIM